LAITSVRLDSAKLEHEIENRERERLTEEADFVRKIINGLTAGSRMLPSPDTYKQVLEDFGYKPPSD
jgi:hypothetical protein